MSLNSPNVISEVSEVLQMHPKGAKGLLKLCKYDPAVLAHSLIQSGYEHQWVESFITALTEEAFEIPGDVQGDFVVLGHLDAHTPKSIMTATAQRFHMSETVSTNHTIEISALPDLIDIDVDQTASVHALSRTSNVEAIQQDGPKIDYHNPPPSAQIGDYRIDKTLGEGGMGQVLLGTEKATGRRYAIKQLLASMNDHSEAYKRFEREVQTMKGLSHPSITAVYQQGHTEKGPFMVMELVDGKTLPDLLMEAGGRLSPQITTIIVYDLLSALAHAHEKDILHRDLKLSNMMVNHQGEFKLMDFGVAKLLGEQGLTKTGMVIGTVDFMSPEQALGRDLSPATDLFCVGLILFTMMSGRSFYRRSTPTDSMIAITREPAPRIFEELPFTPYVLEYIVSTLTEKDPDDRKHNATELLALLKPFVDAIHKRHPGLLKRFVADPAGVHLELCDNTSQYYRGCAQHFASQNHPACASLYAYRACLITPKDQNAAQSFNEITTTHSFNYGKPKDERIATLEKFVFDDPDDIESLTALTNACAEEGNWHRYASYMRRLVKLLPDQKQTYENTLRTVDPEYGLLNHTGWLGPNTAS